MTWQVLPKLQTFEKTYNRNKKMSFSGVSYWLFLLGLFLAVGSPGASASTDELNSAFLAVFGKSAPVERHVKQQAPGATDAQENDVDLSLTPQFLVPLKDGRYALVVNETTRSTRAGGAPNNAISIAYLSHADGAWAVEHVWLEVGGLGVAGNAGSEVKTFGADPIYFSTEEWCGFNSCSDTMQVLVLEAAGPHVIGEIKGGAVYPVDFPDAHPPDCETYKYTARVSSPSSSAGRFSVTYEGWTAAYRKLLPKHRFRRTADVVEKGGTLVTGLQTPDCMR
jgi:hypothetical protein